MAQVSVDLGLCCDTDDDARTF